MESEEALRASEERYRSLFDQMLDAFAVHEIICDADGAPVDYRFLSVNPAFEAMTGLRVEDVVGRTVLEVLPGTDQRWIDTYGKVALTGEPVAFSLPTRPGARPRAAARRRRGRPSMFPARAAIAIHGPDGRLLQTNPLADELLGLGAAEGTGRALTDTSWQFLQAGP